MVVRTRRSPLTWLLLIALGAGAAFLPWPSILGNSDIDDGNVVEITVAFSPSPRPTDAPVTAIITVQGEKVTHILHESPYGETHVVKSGGWVSVHAIQISPGTTACSIKVNSQNRSHDFTQDTQPAACAVKV